jgi:putrescine importer
VDTTTGVQTEASSAPRLKRVLSLWDLIYYGIILTSPIAAVPLFGEAQVLSRGHTVTTLLLGTIAMSVTAISFGRLANLHPASGSVYSYVSRMLNPHVGFILGWGMFLEYLFQPIQNALYAMLTIQRLMPRVPFAVLALLTVGLTTLLAVQGIRFNARANELLLGFALLVTAVFFVEAIRHIVFHQSFAGLFSVRPIYNPATFNVRALAQGTSFAALVFIGFDGVTLLAEEVKNPKRNVLLAALLVCIFTGLFSGLQIYMAQLIWPDATTLQNPETAFMDVARIAGGSFLFIAYGVLLVVTSLACGLAGHVGAARLLYSMGRDEIISRKIFAHLNPVKGNPIRSEWIVGIVVYVAVLVFPWELAAEIVTFGALLAFTAVNLVALLHFWFAESSRGRRNFFADALVPGFGCVFCFVLLIGLQRWTKYAGLIWLALGTIYAGYRTRMFTVRPKLFNLNET